MRYFRGRFGTSISSRSSGISGMICKAAPINRSRRSTSCAGDRTGPVFSSSFRNSTTCAMFCAKTNLSPRDRTGIERAPRRCNSARPAGSSSTLIDWNSIPRTERNSLSLRQLVQAGCQNAFRVAVSGIAVLLVNAGSTCAHRRPSVNRRPGIHRTDSLDYAVIMKGEIDMELETGDITHLKAGDVIVQRGTVHNWVNRGPEPCVIAFVLIAAKPVEAGGKVLKAFG